MYFSICAGLPKWGAAFKLEEQLFFIFKLVVILNQFRDYLCYRFLIIINKTGNTANTNRTDKVSPPIVPVAKANQNTSCCPPTKKGTSPKQVESTVRIMGRIFPRVALRTARLYFRQRELFRSFTTKTAALTVSPPNRMNAAYPPWSK